MELQKESKYEASFWDKRIIAEKIWKLLWEVRFLNNKERIPNTKHLKVLLKTKEELLPSINNKSNKLKN